ncbi:uncharacterized protein LOC133734419 isoform X2 [Rosa rugosa]|uniref:uncharacterized protein LOC133734419 isoform X2 n=1 Tax=Rosa rugosa TaxID=74645 RepID=UPI002B406471|nr:uncharacterized protein LOC133734419 isoform X2 [Rosa rugosa]
MRRRVKGLVLRAQARIFLAWISSGISFLESKRYSKSAGKKTVEYMVALAEKSKDMSMSAGTLHADLNNCVTASGNQLLRKSICTSRNGTTYWSVSPQASRLREVVWTDIDVI